MITCRYRPQLGKSRKRGLNWTSELNIIIIIKCTSQNDNYREDAAGARDTVRVTNTSSRMLRLRRQYSEQSRNQRADSTRCLLCVVISIAARRTNNRGLGSRPVMRGRAAPFFMMITMTAHCNYNAINQAIHDSRSGPGNCSQAKDAVPKQTLFLWRVSPRPL